MNTGISINKYIYQLLINDEQLRKLVGKSIYPIIAEETTVFPFIIFRRNELNTIYSKDGKVQDVANISIAIATKSYNENVEIAERVRSILELKRNDYFNRITLSSVTEDFVDDAYIIELSFDVIIK